MLQGRSASPLCAEETRGSIVDRHFFLLILAVWLIASTILLIIRAHAIGAQDFLDVDDQMRLLEVRDWLSGQSFYDVTQYRLNPPQGSPMHWSRLVDMPLAAMILILRPFIGTATAEMVTIVVVPLITLGAILLFAALTGRRLGSSIGGIAAAILAACCIPVIVQVLPMRIDHHGWEITLSMVALFGVVDSHARRSGMVAGVAIATALQVSLEALPFAVAIGAVLGVSWLVEPSRDTRVRLVCFVLSLAAAELLLFTLLHVPDSWGNVYCDGVSPPQLTAMTVAAVGVIGMGMVAAPPFMVRLLMLAVVGALGLASYHAFPPHCGVDAFSNLEPNVRHYWYERVLEGRPVWENFPVVASSTVGFPLIGLLCALLRWRRTIHPVLRSAWFRYFSLLAAATVVAFLVRRAGGLANAAAAPAAAIMLIQLIRRTIDHRHMLVRVLGTSALILGLSPVSPVAAMVMIAGADPDAPVHSKANATPVRSCNGREAMQALNALPPARIFTSLDVAPALIFFTHHHSLASGYHRNHVAMSQVIAAFTGSAEVAHEIIRRRGMQYVMICPNVAELSVYERFAPKSFTDQLLRERVPPWLQRVRIKGSPAMLWRVTS